MMSGLWLNGYKRKLKDIILDVVDGWITIYNILASFILPDLISGRADNDFFDRFTFRWFLPNINTETVIIRILINALKYIDARKNIQGLDKSKYRYIELHF